MKKILATAVALVAVTEGLLVVVAPWAAVTTSLALLGLAGLTHGRRTDRLGRRRWEPALVPVRVPTHRRAA